MSVGASPRLQVQGLRIETTSGVVIVDDVSFDVASGEVLALVGESGSGKTSTALALLAYAREGLRIVRGSVLLGGRDLLGMHPSELQRSRGATISYVPQDPAAALNPRQRIESVLAEALRVHHVADGDARKVSTELLERVGLPATEEFLKRYPFELSGGQQQRVLIALALACQPDVVVLDEPTTGLDVTTQARILELLGRLRRESRLSFVYVTHDLAVVDQVADRVAVMYSGAIVEHGPRERVLRAPAHPYTVRLLEAVPRLSQRYALTGVPGAIATPASRPSGCPFHPRCPLAVARCAAEAPPPSEVGARWDVRCWRAGELRFTAPMLAPVTSASPGAETPLLVADSLVAGYRDKGNPAVEGVSFALARGESLAIVGESGSGKSTTARCVAGLHEPWSGTIAMNGEPVAGRVAARTQDQKRAVQIVFQNPDRSLNPSLTIGRIIERPLLRFGLCAPKDARKRAAELLQRVHLSAGMLDRYPHQLSGGEKQRVAIARALAVRPEVLICDEVTSALDVSIQATIVELLSELRQDGLSLLFITHNLALVNSIADRALVLHNGRVCEEGTTAGVLESPRDDYTRELVAAALDLAAADAPEPQGPVDARS